MRDFHLFTNTKITAEDCLESLKKEIAGIVKNGEKGIMIQGKNRAYLWFTDDRILDCFESTIDEFQRKVPIENAYITDFETYRSVDAKKVFAVLMQIYPEIYINVDDSSNWYGTAQEYIDTAFDY